MSPLKIFFLIFFSLILTGCGEVFYCRNPSSVALLHQLPCSNCEFKGTVKPDFCPNGTYPHKLQCAAGSMGANVVLLKKLDNEVQPSYPVYTCPVTVPQSIPRNDKTDVSNSCTC